MNLCAVARETVDSCTPIASPIIFKLSGLNPETPSRRKVSCRRTISLATLRMVRARCSRLLVSQLAACRWVEMYWRSSSRFAPGLRLEAPDLGQHVAQILVVDPAQAAQQRKVPPGERGQVLDESLHRRI